MAGSTVPQYPQEVQPTSIAHSLIESARRLGLVCRKLAVIVNHNIPDSDALQMCAEIDAADKEVRS